MDRRLRINRRLFAGLSGAVLATASSKLVGAQDDASPESSDDPTVFLTGDAAASTPVGEGEAEPVLPATAETDAGEVTVEDLSRIFITNESSAEIVYALGVGEGVIYAPETFPIPEGMPQPETVSNDVSTVEGIVSLDPTLVLAGTPRREGELITELQSVGVAAALIDGSRPAPEKIRTHGQLLGVPERGEDLATKIEEQLAEAATITEGLSDDQKPRVLVVSSRGAGDSGNATAAGQSTPAHQLIEGAGGINVGAEAGLDRYQAVTPEGVVQMAPEVVVVAEYDYDVWGGTDGVWENVPGLMETPAYQTGRLIVMSDLQVRTGSVSVGAATIALANELVNDRKEA